MGRYIIRRVLYLIPVIICVSFLIFALMDLTPGTIVDSMITDATTPQQVAEIKAKYDLDKPMVYRYGKYMVRLVQGDLGVSDVTNMSVFKTYISRLPATLELSLASLVIGSSIAIPLGIRAARRAGTIGDSLTTVFTLVGMSMPAFWLGLLLLLLFSMKLRWLPAGGNHGIVSFILPAVCSGLMLMAGTARQTRSSMLEVLHADYLRTARAKGVPEKQVIRKHALGNAWIPILTTVGVSLSNSPGRLGHYRIRIRLAGGGPAHRRGRHLAGRQADLRQRHHDNDPVCSDASSRRPDLCVRRSENKSPVREYEQKKETGGMSRNTEAKALVSKKYKKRSNFGDILHRIKKNKGAVVGLCIIGVLVITLLVSLLISYASITATNISIRFQHPSAQHLFGTDSMGRDVFLRTIYGARYSLAIGFGSSLFAAVIGIFVGSISGFYGGILDEIIMRLTDVLASIPGLLLGMVIVSVLGGSLLNLLLAVGICSVQYYIRITRASIISIRGQEYVEAARAIGMPNIKIIFTQVLPNGLSPIIVIFSGTLGIAILIAAGLSFLGLGVPVPQPEWGALISEGRNYIRTASYLSTFPGLFIMITVLAFNLVGDGLRDALDPKLKR